MAERILICGVNWLGDSVMTMPALQALRLARPGAQIDLLVKPPLVELWQLHDVPDNVLPLGSGLKGLRQAAGQLRAGQHQEAYVFPNSLRSALAPWMARVPARVGAAGHYRAWLLTELVQSADSSAVRTHQREEYYRILGLPKEAPRESPGLAVPADLKGRWREQLEVGDDERLVGIIPGAARGPSKRWPSDRFAAVGRELAGGGARVLVLGAPSETDVCTEVAEACGAGAVSLAGKTTLTDLVALLELCQVLVCNDSGGMHLATAVNTPVVAIFGMTDPAKTGPLGAGNHVLLKDGVKRTRDVPRDCSEASEALAAVSVDEVCAAARKVLGWTTTA